ncbi:hypothetical protein [Tenacibaculum agarivorans]|uniref:hypothetical protein n=1 Tax=Tenacibaculum agarivorans TaxID=1908389 RepID=UPI00094BB223|nr:hypothetical protein [Tenacibaculum agarivorans]
MKKIVCILVAVISFTLQSCTDTSVVEAETTAKIEDDDTLTQLQNAQADLVTKLSNNTSEGGVE